MSTQTAKSTFDATEEEPPKLTNDIHLEVAVSSEPPDPKMADGSAALSKDVIFDILMNQRRRRVIGYLRERGKVTLSDLAEHVAALEQDKDVRSLSSGERKRVYVGLYQCHLPRMSDAGLIDYNQARGTIDLRESAAQLFPYLDLDRLGNNTGKRTGWGRSRGFLDSLSSLLNL